MKNEKGSVVLIVIGVFLTLAVVTGAFLFMNYNNTKKEGIAAVEDYISLVKKGSSEKLKQTVLSANGVDENSTNPEEQELIAKTGAQIAYVSRAINDKGATKYKDSFGTDESGNKQVSVYYELEINGKKAYYQVSSTEVGSEWKITRINLDESKL